MLAKPDKKRPGRRPFKPTSRQRDRAMTLAAVRLSLNEIAAILNISRTSLTEHFKHELQIGRAMRLAEVVEQLRKAAKGGNVSAARALLQTFSDPELQVGKKEAAAEKAKAIAEGTNRSKWSDLLNDPTPQVEWSSDLINGRFRDFPEN
jgi:AcrR family transcriptional regulator